MIPGKTYKSQDLLLIAWRRKWLVVVPLVLVCLVTWIWSRGLPNLYQSETVILVVPQRVPDTYVRSTISTPIEDRLQSISPQILSRTRLEQIIHDLGLYVEEQKIRTMEEVVLMMRRNIVVETIKGDAFRVTYISDHPVKAMEVTSRLASMFIDENLRDRETLAEGTNEFLVSQLDEARARLVEREKALEEYRRTYAGELPSQVGPNLQSIQNSQMQLQALSESIGRDRDRVTLLEGLVAQALAINTDAVVSAAAPVSPGDPAFAVGGSTADRLETARRSLALLETRLTAEHPDIRRLQRIIRDLERSAGAEAVQQSDENSKQVQQPLTAAEAAKRARVGEMELEIKSLRQRIAYQEGEQDRLRQVISTYERRIEAAPTRESQLAELTRDYETLQNVYVSLLTRREDSKIAANLERRQVGEQFRILDPPRVPEKAFSPNRIKLNAIGALFGLAFGIGLVALIEYRNTSLHTEEDVAAAFGLPVVALIPVMTNQVDRRQRLRRRFMVCGAAAAVLLLVAVVAMATFDLGIR
jgi:polysaccharide chain length determinant protein (PEP-CTERM system associated)